MTLFRILRAAALTGAALFALAGCGGGSSNSSTPGGGTGTSSAMIYAVDDLNTGYAHVWVTINKITLTSSTGTTTTIFDATGQGGKTVDLRSLHDATGDLYLLLGACNTPSGTYASIDVNVASSLTVVPTGASTGTAATFSNASNGTADLTLTFGNAQTISASAPIVIDFNLANWNLSGSTVSATNNAYLSQGTTATIKQNGRQSQGDYFGAASSLSGTAPNQTFTLSGGKSSINVVTSASTTIVNSDGSSNPALANGDKLLVTGTWDATNNVLDALNITIQVGGGTTPPLNVRGIVTAFDATADTLTLSIQGCQGFQPTTTNVNIVTTTSTTYFGSSGVTDTAAQFFTGLVDGTTQVEATGTYSNGTLTVTSLELSSAPGLNEAIELAVRGTTSNASTTAGTFDLTVSNWEGDPAVQGKVVHVVTGSGTLFFNQDAASASGAFFGSLTSSTVVSVVGAFEPSTSTLNAAVVGVASDPGHFHF